MADTPGPIHLCGGASTPETAPGTGLVILPWQCPLCEGQGRWGSGERCMECHGRGAITREEADVWRQTEGVTLTPTPVPPGVMRAPCADCAFRPGAPEEDERPPMDRPFYCHHGMPIVDGAYAPVAWADAKPLGALVCRGWWDAATGKDLPVQDYRPARDGWGAA